VGNLEHWHGEIEHY